MTINKLKLGLVIGFLALISGVSSASAADNLIWTADATYNLSGVGVNVTILNGARANGLVVNTDNLVFDASSTTVGASITSTSRFTVTGTATQSCDVSTGINTVTIAAAAGSVTLAPTGALCSASGGTGSGTPPPSPAPGSTGSADVTGPTALSLMINGNAAVTNNQNVTLSLSASDTSGVASMMISNDVNYTGGVWEGYAASKAWVLPAGNGMKTVYAKFKDAVGNVSAAVSDSIDLQVPAGVTIIVTPVPPTQAEIIANLQAQINILIAQINAMSATQGYNFTVNLTVGSRGADVTALQTILIEGGFLHIASPTGYFGTLTKAAVASWQASVGISATGFFGPISRARLNNR